MESQHGDPAEQARKRQEVDRAITELYAREDDALRSTVAAAAEAGMPPIQISPIQGQLLAVLVAASRARRVLELGTLAGYSGIWMARALPPGGRLISLDVSLKHADVARGSFDRAGVADRVEVRVGPAAELLPALEPEAPFDLVFIDADKEGYPTYLEWALRLSRPGSIIVADNVLRNWGEALRPPSTGSDSAIAAMYAYNQRAATDPRLRSIALPIDEDGRDGLAISVVL